MGHRVSAVSSKRKPLAGTETAPAPAVEPVAVYASLERAFSAASFDAAFICSPTAFMPKRLFSCCKNRCPAFTWKTVVRSVEPVPTIRALLPGMGRKSVLVTTFILNWFCAGKHPLSCNGIAGGYCRYRLCRQHLPQWRPHEDHRTGMSAKRKRVVAFYPT